MELATLLVERCLPEALQPVAGGYTCRQLDRTRGCNQWRTGLLAACPFAVSLLGPHNCLPLPSAAQSADLFGEVCDARALGEQLMRMGEALGFTTVPLTPGGSVAVEVEEGAAGSLDAAAAAQQGSEEERRAAEEEEQAALDAAAAAAAGQSGEEGGSEISELSSSRTTSEE